MKSCKNCYAADTDGHPKIRRVSKAYILEAVIQITESVMLYIAIANHIEIPVKFPPNF